MTHAPPALAVADLSHRFGKTAALDGVSLTVPQGAFVALLGPNGAGKTTLFNLITRLYVARSGRILVRGEALHGSPGKALAQMGVVFQSAALDRSLTVAQNMAYQGALYGIGRREALRRAEAGLARLRMADRMSTRVDRLSGGQARRVEIARALLHEPSLLLCDEATVGVDMQTRAEIVADVHALAAERGVGVLWSTHLIEEIHPRDQVYVLHKGRIRAEGAAEGLAENGDLAAAFLRLTQTEEIA